MRKKSNVSPFGFIIFLVVSIIFYVVLYLYTKYFDVMKSIFNFILIVSICIYAFFCERMFRKGFVTQHIAYPIILIIVYLLFMIMLFSSPQMAMDGSSIELIFIYTLSVMIFALPIAVLFDVVTDIRYVHRKKRKKTGNILADDYIRNRGIFFENEKFEDMVIFIIAVIVIYFIICLFQ